MMQKNTNLCHDPSVFQRLVMVCRQAYGNTGSQQLVENPKKIAHKLFGGQRLVGVALIALLVNALILSIAIPAAAQSPLWARRAKIFGTSEDIREGLSNLAAARANAANGTSSLNQEPSSTSSKNVRSLAPSFSISIASSWSSANSLSVKRFGHTATRLLDGRVLVAGGFDYTGDNPNNAPVTLQTADIYDPGTNSWAATGSMTVARSGHTATLLPDGKVLVAGGSDNDDNSLKSAEIFDPAGNGGAGSWSLAAPMSTKRDAHSAVLLGNGRVLVAGGERVILDADPDCPSAPDTPCLDALDSAEIYNPSGNSWTATGSLGTKRENHTMTLLGSGKVLVAGGDTFDYNGATNELVENTLNTAEVFDPAGNAGVGSWSGTANNMSDKRVAHTATLLGNGKVLVVAGDNFSRDDTVLTESFIPLLSVDLYDPTANTFSAAASLSATREDHTATLLFERHRARYGRRIFQRWRRDRYVSKLDSFIQRDWQQLGF